MEDSRGPDARWGLTRYIATMEMDYSYTVQTRGRRSMASQRTSFLDDTSASFDFQKFIRAGWNQKTDSPQSWEVRAAFFFFFNVC